jgi:tetratricopeptide (TPR) repeat protein
MNENLERGIGLLRKALRSSPTDSGSWLKLAHGLIAAQRPGEVVDLFCDLVSAVPNRPQMHYNLLSGLIELGPHYAAMLKAFEEAVGTGLAAAAAYYGLGLIRQIGGDPEQALQCFEQALQKDTGLAAVHHNKAVIFLSQEKVRQAVAAGEAALRQEPTMAEPHFLLGSILMHENRLQESLTHFEEFVAMARTPDLAPYANSASLSVSLLREKMGR